jgi:hypothetical protein
VTYVYRGAEAMVRLHDSEMRRFFAEWETALSRGVVLPKSEDPDTASLAHLMRHVLSSACSYMEWICRVLELPDPKLDPVPEAKDIARLAEESLSKVLHRWALPLVEVEEDRFFRPGYPTRWGLDVCVESMLEHAIVHPMRHRYQLEGLAGERL